MAGQEELPLWKVIAAIKRETGSDAERWPDILEHAGRLTGVGLETMASLREKANALANAIGLPSTAPRRAPLPLPAPAPQSPPPTVVAATPRATPPETLAATPAAGRRTAASAVANQRAPARSPQYATWVGQRALLKGFLSSDQRRYKGRSGVLAEYQGEIGNGVNTRCPRFAIRLRASNKLLRNVAAGNLTLLDDDETTDDDSKDDSDDDDDTEEDDSKDYSGVKDDDNDNYSAKTLAARSQTLERCRLLTQPEFASGDRVKFIYCKETYPGYRRSGVVVSCIGISPGQPSSLSPSGCLALRYNVKLDGTGEILQKVPERYITSAREVESDDDSDDSISPSPAKKRRTSDTIMPEGLSPESVAARSLSPGSVCDRESPLPPLSRTPARTCSALEGDAAEPIFDPGAETLEMPEPERDDAAAHSDVSPTWLAIVASAAPGAALSDGRF